MKRRPRTASGYSLVEVLVVLAIFGILSIVGVSMLGNRRGASVRSMLDELEGALNNARSQAMATGRDVAIETWGTWGTANPLVLAYGDYALTQNLLGDQLPVQAQRLLAGQAPDGTVAYSQTAAVPFHFLPNDSTQSRACVVVAGVDTTDWGTAMTAIGSGAVNVDITTKDPFLAGDPMSGLVTNASNLFQNATTQAVVSGSNQRFTTNFIIQIVGTSPDSGSLPGSPMGLIVVLANGSSIYKFYNPGVREGDGQWRRL